MDQGEYVAAIDKIRSYIAGGDVYQANLCRVLSAPLRDPSRTDIVGLARLLARGNPAPYPAVVRLPRRGVQVVSASPELFLRRRGSSIASSPIQGTARTADELLEKEYA